MKFMSVSVVGGLLLLAVGAAAGGPATVIADRDLYTGRPRVSDRGCDAAGNRRQSARLRRVLVPRRPG
jgi:hypothetical protein